MPRLLVTGASGYIGSHLVHLLAKHHFEVVGVDMRPFPHAPPIGYKHFQANLSEKEALGPLRTLSYEGVFHLATSSDMSATFSEGSEYKINELLKLENLIELVSDAEKTVAFVFASSCSVYGNVDGSPASEDSSLDPLSPYAEAKVACEGALYLAGKQKKVRARITRFFNVVGARGDLGLREDHEPETHLVPNIVNAHLHGLSLTIFGSDFDTPDGTAIRDYVDVEDICEGLLAAYEFPDSEMIPFRVWNLGSERGVSVLEVVNCLEEITGEPLKIEWSERRQGDPARALADATRANLELGWAPKRALRHSILAVLGSTN